MIYQILLAVFILAVSADPLNEIQDVTYSMSQLLGEQLDFEYYTGYIPVGSEAQQEEGGSSLFFSMVTKTGETIADMSPDTPVIFWFNGGPGCSSQYGTWLEIGPLQLDQQLQASLREYSWNREALLVFTDQPINAGFSYSSNTDVLVLNTKQATMYFERFITKFYDHFDNLVQNPTYFFGESYAGHYIPDFASMILKNNPVLDLNFQGIGIGDGWTNPKEQFGSMSDFFYNAGVASQGQREEIIALQDEGIKQIEEENYSAATNLFDAITDDTEQYGDIDQYNFFHYNRPGQEDPNTIPYFEELLNNSDFLRAYGVPGIIPPFTNCNNTIYDKFSDDFTQSYQEQVEYLLTQDIKVMLYNGQLDIIVNGAGAQDWINTLVWDKLRKWQYSPKTVWHNPDATKSKEVFGNYQTYSNFCYVNVYLAGHMVPSDQPEASYIMLQNFLDWSW